MPRVFTIVSIVVHAFVLGGAVVAQLLAIGSLPTPRRPLTFEGATPVRVVDIQLPGPRRPSPHTTAPAVALRQDVSDAAPLEAPSAIGHEVDPLSSTGTVVGVPVGDGGIGSVVGIGAVVRLPAATPPAPPQAPIRLHSGMQAPRKLVHVDPRYPAVAQSARVEGVVILEAVIDARGAVTSVGVLRSIPLLDQAAIDAVRQWVFTPTLLNGVAVPVKLTVTVQFSLHR